MKLETSTSPRRAAFTLVELLVVISIIAILAGIIIPLAGIAYRKKVIARTQVELKSFETAIESYKSKTGTYPPDNPGRSSTNQLFYELCGAVLNSQGNAFTNQFYPAESISSVLVNTFFNVGGFANSSPDKGEIRNFFPTLNAGQIKNINSAAAPVRILVVGAKGPNDITIPGLGDPANPVNYVSTNPTNNSTYDLWADVKIGGTTYRISNWSKEPQPVN